MTLPLRIITEAEAVMVVDAADRVVALITIHPDRARSEVLKRLPPDDAAGAAKLIRPALINSTAAGHGWD